MSGRMQNVRQHIAREAARMMVESGIEDFDHAKRKAADRLRVDARGDLPRNVEIEEALLEYQRLFHSDDQPCHLAERREAALQAMRLLRDFRPKLVGAVLSGSAGEHSRVVLHLLAEPPEGVGLFLENRGVEHRDAEARVRFGPKETARLPALRFFAGDVELELVLFGERDWRKTPLSAVDGKPMKRANESDVTALVALG